MRRFSIASMKGPSSLRSTAWYLIALVVLLTPMHVRAQQQTRRTIDGRVWAKEILAKDCEDLDDCTYTVLFSAKMNLKQQHRILFHGLEREWTDRVLVKGPRAWMGTYAYDKYISIDCENPKLDHLGLPQKSIGNVTDLLMAAKVEWCCEPDSSFDKACEPPSNRGPYETKEAAMKAALQTLAQCPARCNKEWCGNIQQALNEKYYIYGPFPGGGLSGCQPIREMFRLQVATFHNHPSLTKKSEEFSDIYDKEGKRKGDKASAEYRGIPSHLLTASGVHKIFDPNKKDDPKTEKDERVTIVEKKIKNFKRCDEF